MRAYLHLRVNAKSVHHLDFPGPRTRPYEEHPSPTGQMYPNTAQLLLIVAADSHGGPRDQTSCAVATESTSHIGDCLQNGLRGIHWDSPVTPNLGGKNESHSRVVQAPIGILIATNHTDTVSHSRRVVGHRSRRRQPGVRK
jgi:hypothetical protein